MSRGLTGQEALEIYERAMKRKAEQEADAKDRKRLRRPKKPGIKLDEASATKQVQDALDLAQVPNWKIWHGKEAPNNAEGISDILAVLPVPVQALVDAGIKTVGVALAVEMKGDNGRVSPAQAQFLYRWEKAGGIGLAAWGIDDVKAKLKMLGLPGLKGIKL
jgi:hypothetical protein